MASVWVPLAPICVRRGFHGEHQQRDDFLSALQGVGVFRHVDDCESHDSVISRINVARVGHQQSFERDSGWRESEGSDMAWQMKDFLGCDNRGFSCFQNILRSRILSAAQITSLLSRKINVTYM